MGLYDVRGAGGNKASFCKCYCYDGTNHTNSHKYNLTARGLEPLAFQSMDVLEQWLDDDDGMDDDDDDTLLFHDDDDDLHMAGPERVYVCMCVFMCVCACVWKCICVCVSCCRCCCSCWCCC